METPSSPEGEGRKGMKIEKENKKKKNAFLDSTIFV
jgi:hypothetical protein